MKAKKELNIQIGSRVKTARETMRYTQENLAERIDVSVQYISDLERGVVGASLPTIIKLCQVLHTSSDFLLMGKLKAKNAVDHLTDEIAAYFPETVGIGGARNFSDAGSVGTNRIKRAARAALFYEI